MSSKGDSELVVMRDVYKRLGLLSFAEQGRVLEWVIKRLHEDNGKPFMASPSQPPSQANKGSAR